MSEPTPMLRQYLDLKKKYPGTILFFRLGDFYEMFNEDAEIGAKELDITLTARQKKSDKPIPMCGVPHHAASSYIAKLVRKGYRVAICEQTEDAAPGKKLVKRDVVRVITPGTAIDEQLLEKTEPVFLASISGSGGSYGLAYLELSTGEFTALEFDGTNAWGAVVSDLETMSPKELLYPFSLKPLVESQFGRSESGSGLAESLFEDTFTLRNTSLTTTQLTDSTYDIGSANDLLSEHFEVRDLAGFGLDGKANAVSAAGACLQYALDTQKASVSHISSVSLIETKGHMVLDALTIRNLELLKGNDGAGRNSLLGILNETVTSMGARTLRSWILRPSIRISEINARKQAVSELSDAMLRDQLRFHLKKVSDLERLIGRVNLGKANPRDLVSIADSLAEIPFLKGFLGDSRANLLRMLRDNIDEHASLCRLISSSIIEDPPVNTADGGFIREGYSPELDEIRLVAGNAKRTIAGFEKDAREETGISSLHIKFNNVFGYFIEVSKANLAKVPEHYERRQTLTNSERFTTPKLKQWEAQVLGAEEKIKAIESELFSKIISTIAVETQKLQKTAYALANLDVLASLAETAVSRGYIEPDVHEGDDLMIKNGRHPVVEAVSDEPFIPNDLSMNNSTDRLLIITGANMGGKSTVLRQAALIQILAQIGSFVPATNARLPITDRIWTRVGASDDLSSGRSTFMVEMTETAMILHNATPKSLILLDEIGRGTSTFDGLAIAWAVAEYLHDSPEHSAKTLFATHYHELTELAEKLKGARNYQISAKEIDGKVVFLHKLKAGKASQSYGIAVAKLAGLPAETIQRAKEVLKTLEEFELAVFSDAAHIEKGMKAAAANSATTSAAAQVSLFAISNEALIDELRETNTDS
ncbi:MAG: DNA mismatch repair protein MutS, partial [Pyrinomonadaceae bacterium]|nr:DNA mismatch repair protein MutS [Pyrinomonadaceae bacterium]